MMPISKYVINLECRRDRKTEMEHQLRRVGWRAQFFNAIRPDHDGGFPSIGAHGCYLSHLAVLKHALPHNAHILIMEDDLDFVAGFSRTWDRAFDALETVEWSIWYPGHFLTNHRTGLQIIDPNQGLRCTHFILFNRSTVRKVIDSMEAILARPPGHPNGGPMHVDGAYSTIRAQNPDLKTFVFLPSLGFQRSSRSDIANVNFYDRISVLRPFISRLRLFKRHFRRPL
jgi:glycosyl transferase family 25